MESKKLHPSFQESIDFVASFQNDEGEKVSIMSQKETSFPTREEGVITLEEYTESAVLYGLSM